MSASLASYERILCVGSAEGYLLRFACMAGPSFLSLAHGYRAQICQLSRIFNDILLLVPRLERWPTCRELSRP